VRRDLCQQLGAAWRVVAHAPDHDARGEGR